MIVLDLLRKMTRRRDGDRASIVLASARSAQADGRWAEAADLYEEHARLRPKRAGTALQLGNMLKEVGRLEEAEAAYRRSLVLRETTQARLQLGYLMLDQGRLEGAVDMFVSVLARQPALAEAKHGLVMAGGRDRLPIAEPIPVRRLGELGRLVETAQAVLAEAAQADVTPLQSYGAWRVQHPLPPPPAAAEDGEPLAVCIDARGTSPFLLRATLQSLGSQSRRAWRAWVVADRASRAHPVTSAAEEDVRITVSEDDRSFGEPVLHLPAGVMLEPSALAWFVAAAEITGADAVYADHDHIEQGGMAGERRTNPVFHQAPAPFDLETMPDRPWAVLSRTGAPLDRAALAEAAREHRAAHIPLILSSVVRPPEKAMGALPEPGDERRLIVRDDPPKASIGRHEGDIRIVIPTRDEAEMLERCIRSLIERAAAPGGVRVLVLDNRSVEAATRAFLEAGSAAGDFEVAVLDEPFNWSRFNNLGARQSSEDLLLFLNNDTEVLTTGWDDRLRAVFADPQVGAAGARLLYPDGTLQHGGLVLGLGDGAPRHEGVGAASSDVGPDGRWSRRREAAAVTGAFLATRRSVFEAVAGFDPELAVAYNDIDYCLAVRAAGASVVYVGDIVVTHYESRTRGRNRSRERVAWDIAEQTSLVKRWGDGLMRDPSVNPHWRTGSPRPFDGVRQPSVDEILAWLRPRPLQTKAGRREGR